MALRGKSPRQFVFLAYFTTLGSLSAVLSRLVHCKPPLILLGAAAAELPRLVIFRFSESLKNSTAEFPGTLLHMPNTRPGRERERYGLSVVRVSAAATLQCHIASSLVVQRSRIMLHTGSAEDRIVHRKRGAT